MWNQVKLSQKDREALAAGEFVAVETQRGYSAATLKALAKANGQAPAKG